MVTPMSAPDQLDQAGLERLIEYMLEGGVNGLFILGTTGEGPALSYALRRELIDRVCEQVGARVPVLVGITDTSYGESLHVADHAARRGATAVVAAAPYYFPLRQSDLIRLIESWARDCALPIHLYNFPALTKVWFEVATVAHAAEIPNVHGIKDSSGDLAYVRQLLQVRERRPEFSVLVGPEHLLAEALELGADGGVPGGANLFPHLLAKLYSSFRSGDHEQMRAVQAEIVRIGAPIFDPLEADSSYVARLKCALALRGVCNDLPTWPFGRVPAPDVEAIRQHMQAHGLLPAKSGHGLD